jgi:hypothetical protein
MSGFHRIRKNLNYIFQFVAYLIYRVYIIEIIAIVCKLNTRDCTQTDRQSHYHKLILRITSRQRTNAEMFLRITPPSIFTLAPRFTYIRRVSCTVVQRLESAVRIGDYL